MGDDVVTMDKIVALCKRRGFIFPSSEIYGGLGSTYDYGHYGVLLKSNVKAEWWRAMVGDRDDIVAIDSAILQHPRVWEASGHLAGFTDPMVDCKTCGKRFRADHLGELACPQKPSKHPGEGPDCELTEARDFNLMFETHVGPVADTASVAYLRPETAQGIFINFKNVLQFARKRPPFGIAQVGKSFRNEITPGNFIFRTREFEQMEIEFFVKPGTDEEWHERWIQDRLNWYIKYGVKPENLHLRPHDKEELAHYSKGTTDIEYQFPWGWGEIEGIANRADYDLKAHQEHSGKELDYFDEATEEKYIPYVIEPSSGVERPLLAFMIDAYHEEQVRNEKRVALKFHKSLAPIKAAVLPLARNKPEIVEVAHKLADDLRKSMTAVYDDTGSIGKLYRRQDEVGTLWCITVDHQTIEEDNQVTIRDRDTMEQVRVPIEAVKPMLVEKLAE